MRQFQLRVCKEANDLNEKLDKLKAFIEASGDELPRDEFYRLLTQRDIMKAYHSILSARIMEFTATPWQPTNFE